MKKKPLSPREQECFEVIMEYYKDHKVPPTHVYVADKMGIKIRQQVTAIFAKLVEKGYLKKTSRHGLFSL